MFRMTDLLLSVTFRGRRKIFSSTKLEICRQVAFHRGFQRNSVDLVTFRDSKPLPVKIAGLHKQSGGAGRVPAPEGEVNLDHNFRLVRGHSAYGLVGGFNNTGQQNMAQES